MVEQSNGLSCRLLVWGGPKGTPVVIEDGHFIEIERGTILAKRLAILLGRCQEISGILVTLGRFEGSGEIDLDADAHCRVGRFVIACKAQGFFEFGNRSFWLRPLRGKEVGDSKSFFNNR